MKASAFLITSRMSTSAAKSLSPEPVDPAAKATGASAPKGFQVRPRVFETVLDQEFPMPRRKEIYLMPDEGVLTPANEVERTVRRAGKRGVVDFSVGIYEAGLFDAHAELICHDGGTAVLRGESRVASQTVLMRGFHLEAGASGVALSVLSGTAMLEDCEIQGRIEVANHARLLVKNCGIMSEGDAIVVAPGGLAEITASRIVTAAAAVRAGSGSDLSLYACRFQPRDTTPGTAVLSDGARIYAEGCEFFDNAVGVDLRSCPEARFASCAFENNPETALRWEASGPQAVLTMTGCLVATSSYAPPLVIRGGTGFLSHTTVVAPAECLHAAGARVVAENIAWQTSVNDPVGLEGGAALECIEENPASPSRLPGEVSRPETPASVLDRSLAHIDQIIGQETAKNELRRIVQQAWAAGQRGGRINRQSIAAVFLGPARHGQESAAVQLAAALAETGVLRSPDVQHAGLAGFNSQESAAGLFLVDSSREKSDLVDGMAAQLDEAIRGLPEKTALVLSGDGERLRSFLRNHSELHRLIPHEVNFANLEPRDLAAHFKMHCKEERIPVGAEAARKLLIVIHTLHDGFGRQYSDTEGILELFLDVRRNYLARCAAIGRLDAELEPSDVTIPIHRRAMSLWTRSAEFLAICPQCGAETPWLPSLASGLRCIHCGAGVAADWGILRGSSYFRKIQGRAEGVRSGAVTFRKRLPS